MLRANIELKIRCIAAENECTVEESKLLLKYFDDTQNMLKNLNSAKIYCKISRVSYALRKKIYVVLMLPYYIFMQLYYTLEFLQYILALFKFFSIFCVSSKYFNSNFDSSTVHSFSAAMHLIFNSILARSMFATFSRYCSFK